MAVISKDLGAVTAYAAAVNRGYTGTKEEFETLMASYATVAEQAAESAQSAGQSATNASQSAQTAETAKGTAQQAATDAQTAQASAQESAQSAQQSAQSASQSAQTAESAKETAVDAVDGFAAGAQQALDSVNQAGVNWKSLAQAKALDSEAYALGTRDGEDVGSSDPAYHNNAKYYAESVSSSAQTATEAAQTATTKASEAAQSASAAAESARTLTIDATLTQSGQAADAKKTGDAIANVNEELSNIAELFENGEITVYPTFIKQTAISVADGGIRALTGYDAWASTDFIAIPAGINKISSNAASPSGVYGLAFYDSNQTFINDSVVSNYNSFSIDVQDEYKYIRFTSYERNGNHTGVFLKFKAASQIYADTDNFADAVASGRLLTGTYNLNSVVTLAEGQAIIGNECVVIVTDSGQIRMNNGSRISGIKFVGTWNLSREAGDGQTYTSYGYVPLITYEDLSNASSDALFGEDKTRENALIYIPTTGAYNTIVEGCRFENLDRLVIYGGGQRHQEKTSPIICNNYFSDCRMGVYIEGEFIRCHSNEYLRCIIGCYIRGGNSNNYGEIYKCCDVGYYFPSNTGAHNEITAVEAAHCGLAGIYIKYLSRDTGCVINASHFPDAPIVGEDVNNLYITGSIISTWLKYNSGQHNAITCCNIRRTYLYGHTQFDVPSDTLITLNRALSNASDSDVNWTN